MDFSKLFCKAVLLVAVFLLTACGSKKVASLYTHDIECMGSELDGNIILKTWGAGADSDDALEQARKQAINTILFSGITAGSVDCNMRPILSKPNIRETQAVYFNKFFKDKGDYKDFVSSDYQTFGNEKGVASRDGKLKFGFIFRILKVKLEKKMIKDKILNQ